MYRYVTMCACKQASSFDDEYCLGIQMENYAQSMRFAVKNALNTKEMLLNVRSTPNSVGLCNRTVGKTIENKEGADRGEKDHCIFGRLKINSS